MAQGLVMSSRRSDEGAAPADILKNIAGSDALSMGHNTL